MTSKLNHRFAGWLLAGLVLSCTAAQADNGFSISRSRENVIMIGMSVSEVQQLIGRPARAAQFPNAPGPMWTYTVLDPLFGRTEFNIDFGTDGRVIDKGELVIGGVGVGGM